MSLRECPSLLKCDKVIDFANKPQTNKTVSKKFGDVKKISLFERSEFEIFSRRAFCVLLGRAPARAMGSGGRFKEGVRGLARPWLPLLIKFVKPSFTKTYLNKNLIKNYKSKAFKKTLKDKIFF